MDSHLNHIHASESSSDIKHQQQIQLSKVMSFCLNTSTCRQKQIITHFDECFNGQTCGVLCDNCLSPGTIVERDFSAASKSIVEITTWLAHRLDRVTLTSLRYVFVGTGSPNKNDNKSLLQTCPSFGFGKPFVGILERLIPELVMLGGLAYKGVAQTGKHAWWRSYYIVCIPFTSLDMH